MGEPSASGNADGNSTQERTSLVAGYLANEIETIESQNTRPGWTTWAILGALASLTWLLLDTLGSQPIRWQPVWALIVALSLALDAVYLLNILISGQAVPIKEAARFQASRVQLADKRFFLFAMLLRYIALAVIVHLQLAWLSHLPWFLVNFYLYVMGVLALVSFILSCAGSLMPTPNSASKNTLAFLPFPILAIGSFAVTASLACTHYVLVLREWRVALIIVALSSLAMLLGLTQQPSPLLGELKDAYRRLCLGETDVSDVVKEVDLILFGLSLDLALQPDIAEVTDAYGSVLYEMAQAREAIGTAAGIVGDGQHCLTDSQKVIAEALVDSSTDHLMRAQTANDSAFLADRQVSRRLALICRFAPGSVAHLQKIFERLEEPLQPLAHERERLQSEFKAFQEKVNNIPKDNAQAE